MLNTKPFFIRAKNIGNFLGQEFRTTLGHFGRGYMVFFGRNNV